MYHINIVQGDACHLLEYSLFPIGGDPRATDPAYIGQIMASYFEDGEIGNYDAMIPGLTQLASAVLFKDPVWEFAQLNAKTRSTKMYSFEYQGRKLFLSNC